jgi:hypothetical protein
MATDFWGGSSFDPDDMIDETTAPLGIIVSIQIITHCPTCGDEFTPANLSTLSPSGGLTCGPCIGQPRRI